MSDGQTAFIMNFPDYNYSPFYCISLKKSIFACCNIQQYMSGFFGCISRRECVSDVFYGRTTIRIWEQSVPVWNSMTERSSFHPFVGKRIFQEQI